MKINLSKPKQFYIKIIVILFIILMCALIFIKFKRDTNPAKKAEQQINSIFATIDKTTKVNINKYAVYGTHFNIEGAFDLLKISGIKINYIDLVLKHLDNTEQTIKSIFNYSDDVCNFTTSNEINSGLDLETLDEGTYYLFIKATFSNSDIKYYSLSNASDYKPITYYTLSKNGNNNKIDISFSEYLEIPYISIKVTKNVTLPDDVYDIAIDVSHGGQDFGYVSSDIKEADLLLNCGISLKSKLENAGLKVFISRTQNTSSKENLSKTLYDENGKINTLCASHAKILISLDMNNNTYNKNSGRN